MALAPRRHPETASLGEFLHWAAEFRYYAAIGFAQAAIPDLESVSYVQQRDRKIPISFSFFVPNFAIDLTAATTSWRCQPQTVQPSGDRLVNLCFTNENRGNSRFFRLLEKSKLCVAKRLLGEFAATSRHMFPIRLLIFPYFVPCFG
jgi:hypothetical protein